MFIDAFFSQFNSFLEELKEMYPEDQDFPVFISTLALVKSTNPMLVVNFVKSEIVVPFGEKITVRDETFFMEQDFTTRNDVDLNIVQKIKQYIKGMSPQSKEVVWKYIELITKLCLKALE
jgi:hypothetical protein